HERVAADVVTVFETLHLARFPIEEMRIVTQADLDAPPTGDGNNTASFACREVTGGSRFSEHAFGLAIDLNPFHNPYIKGDLILPELAKSYTDRSSLRPGMVTDGDLVVAAFDAIGWGWGGRWRSLEDYHHFALNDR
ncbi:MAG: M15 family metallopeptidase, partial [Acidimicrobiia bacterium]|nr:M15 family metallopeptidase [Acidimicrobiia bacterium]